ncbi:hypothetical protein VTP01DRAFT_4560 [Rhizomucor pusillus]|uniref:uncharacterized protein n=1 Tax=Rhizomucor pusillus TaxID=4840 RepID=UPI003743B824
MATITKLFLLATAALSAVNAQQTFQFKETYPQAGSVPTPKQEWMALLSNANITDAPVVKSSGENGPQQNGEADPYCDWTFTGCTRSTDITTCPKGQWGITYDDGPTQFSPQLYDFLDQTQQKATFFLIGGQVVQFPEHTKRIFDSGHELAMHTWSHSYLTTQTNEQIVAELKWTELAIKEVTGVSPRFFRPPYGDIDDRVRSIAAALGFTPVIWDHDTDDWRMDEIKGFKPEWIDNNATEWASANNTGGGISLEHDLYQSTVDAAKRVLPILQKAYKVVTVGQCTGQASYKEGNANTTAVPTTAAASSAAPSVAASSTGVAPNGPSSGNNNAQQSSGADAEQQAQQDSGAGRYAATSAVALSLAAGISYMLA